mgnify:CR=1 FL=1
MEFNLDILEQFFVEVIEDYRKKIQEQGEAGQLFRRQKELADEVDKKMKAPCPNLYQLVTDYVSSIYDLNVIYQEQLYRQGVKDGIRFRSLVKDIEEEKGRYGSK